MEATYKQWNSSPENYMDEIQEEWINALKEDDLEKILFLIDSMPNFKYYYGDWYEGIIGDYMVKLPSLAAGYGSMKVLKYLLNDPHFNNQDWDETLFTASWFPNPEIIQILLNNKKFESYTLIVAIMGVLGGECADQLDSPFDPRCSEKIRDAISLLIDLKDPNFIADLHKEMEREGWVDNMSVNLKPLIEEAIKIAESVEQRSKIGAEKSQLVPKQDLFVAQRAIRDHPEGRRIKAIKAINPRWSTNVRNNLCSDLENEMYRDELYELAEELDIPVVKRITKKELCKKITDWIVQQDLSHQSYKF